MQQPAPDYRLAVNGQNITPKLSGRLIDLTLDETPGDEADTLSITLSDHDVQLEIPPKGAELNLAIGWKGQQLIEKGLFIVDEASYSWAPNVLTITARSADMRNGLPTRKTRSWDQVTIGEIVNTIASQNNLRPVVSASLSQKLVEHLDQTDESDMNLLTRLGERYGAIFAIKAGRLIFTPRGEAKTANGNSLPEITISPQKGDSGTYREKDRDSYTGVEALWNNVDEGKQEKVMAGTTERVKRLRATYANQSEANAAANAELKRLNRGEAELTISLAIGRPEVGPEFRLRAEGFKPQINGREWVITRASHSLSDSGLITSLDAETLSE
ncbi:MAG: contractile injection system protein, VgrG/Pvc8 family [Pseudohongiella sp.]|uniref:contractile injection system protein, VgrG/Pvc8 family n=1 Tax=Pseudohongiella sp. TaxID=1979412 RepID=UPI0034A01779